MEIIPSISVFSEEAMYVVTRALLKRTWLLKLKASEKAYSMSVHLHNDILIHTCTCTPYTYMYVLPINLQYIYKM